MMEYEKILTPEVRDAFIQDLIKLDLRNNPLLREIKDGDVVLIPTYVGEFKFEIVRVHDLVFEPGDEEYNKDFATARPEVLYSEFESLDYMVGSVERFNLSNVCLILNKPELSRQQPKLIS